MSASRATFPEEGMEITHLLVVRDVARSSHFYREVLGAEPYREYGGNSAVLRLLGCWLLLVTGGPPTEDKPSVSFAPPPDPDLVSRAWTIPVNDCQRAYEVLRARGASLLISPGWSSAVNPSHPGQLHNPAVLGPPSAESGRQDDLLGW